MPTLTAKMAADLVRMLFLIWRTFIYLLDFLSLMKLSVKVMISRRFALRIGKIRKPTYYNE